jgi:hypothetical protein
MYLCGSTHPKPVVNLATPGDAEFWGALPLNFVRGFS